MKEKCKTVIDSMCGTSKVSTPFVAGSNISIAENLSTFTLNTFTFNDLSISNNTFTVLYFEN